MDAVTCCPTMPGETSTGAPPKTASSAGTFGLARTVFCYWPLPPLGVIPRRLWPPSGTLGSTDGLHDDAGVRRQLFFRVSDNYFSRSSGNSNCRRTAGAGRAEEIARELSWSSSETCRCYRRLDVRWGTNDQTGAHVRAFFRRVCGHFWLALAPYPFLFPPATVERH